MTQTIAVVLKAESCVVCGCAFGVPAPFQEHRHADHKGYCCPNGHWQHYTDKTEEQKRIEELEKRNELLRKENDSAWSEVEVERNARKQVQKKLATTRGTLTKTRKRVANGVCPCCSRSFTNLRRHMNTKHPDYADAPLTNATAEPSEQ